MRDAIVIGGGISGLTTARDLVRAGRTIVLVEQRPRLGGLVWTEHIDGLTIEAGPDALLMQKPAAAALCDELGLPLVPTQAPRTAFVLRAGRLLQIPPGSVLGVPIAWRAIIAAAMLSPAGRARLALDLVRPSPPRQSPDDESPDPQPIGDRPIGNQPRRDRPARDDQSIGAFVRRRFGEEAVRYLAQPLLGGIHAGDVERLSLPALFPALAEADREPGSVLRALAARRQRSDPEGVFRSIPNGLGDLIDALARHLPADALRLGCSATRVELGRGPASPIVVQLSSGETVEARALVLALPAYAIAELVAPLDVQLADHCRHIPYASSATITLAYRRATVAHPLAGSGFVVPRGERDTRLLAVSWVTSKWAGRAPDDVVMLRAFAGGTLDADLLERDDDDLAEMAHADLAMLLGLQERPFVRRVYRWWRASPQYEVGHQARVTAISQRLADHPGLFLTGSAFRGVGIPDTIADARRIAAEVTRWLDQWPDETSTAKMID